MFYHNFGNENRFSTKFFHYKIPRKRCSNKDSYVTWSVATVDSLLFESLRFKCATAHLYY